MNNLQSRVAIQYALQHFAGMPLREASVGLLKVLGYQSDRTIPVVDSSPGAFLDLFASQIALSTFNAEKALVSDWRSATLLFQLTDQELSGETRLFKDDPVNAGLLRSYLFFAVELKGAEYARGKLSAIARQINRVFPMPVMVLIKHGDGLSIAVINRRASKLDADKDVLGKVTLIRNIDLANPHPGHLDILASFSVETLQSDRKPIGNFDQLHAAWEEIFNVELLNKRFYRELANWYFWALPQVDFPADTEPDDEKRRATSLIRMLTRLIFCWFLKEKGLVPEKLFNEADLGRILTDLSPDACTYHQAILQNLFFATLNQRMGKDKNGQPFRAFARDEGFQKNRSNYGVDTLYRYEEYFRDPNTALEHFADVPFLNGGLFECLDRIEEGTNRKLYLDGFSRNKKKRPIVPNRLFFAPEQGGIDLSEAYGESNRRNEKVRGLLRILHSYKFTVVENTPIDQEIALDPELLGKVFENLLASYNEETKTTARKQTGSFYTPRPIVEYMVDESLKAHLAGVLKKVGMRKNDAETGLEILFAYTEREHPFREREVAALLEAIHTCKILDPACGSGAFPMGMLQKLVYIIHKLDPDNARWKQIQIDAAGQIPDSTARDAAVAAIERDFDDNEDDYGRKLYLIENCLYGVDIQPIAIQISKLRFFISLICDQKTNRNKKENLGIRPLPNLETKFVAADTLIGLPDMEQLALVAPRVHKIESEIEALYHSHFAIQRRDQKLAVQKKIRELRMELGKLLAESLGSSKKAQHIADWDAFDPQASSDFFDPHWMFGRSLADGFDLVIGNPPFLFISNLDRVVRENYASRYETAEYRFDLYGFFIERAVRGFLRIGGLLTYIIPHTLLSNDSFAKLRKLLLTESTVLQVIDIGPSVFSGASNETMTLLVAKGSPTTSHKVWVRNSNASDFPHGDPEFHIVQKQWMQNPKYSWPVRISDSRYELIRKLTEDSIPLGTLCTINQGLRTGDNSKFIRSTPDGAKWKPVVGGKDIGLFEPIQPKEYVLYDPSVLDAPRKEEIFTSAEKLIVQEIRNISLPRRIVATLDCDQTFALQSTNVINRRANAPKHISLGYILAVINSSTINYFFRQNFPGNNHIASNQLAAIPIRNPSPKDGRVCEILVNLVIFAKGIGEEAPAQFLEDLIDACVMELYFREHMAQRDLLFLDELAPSLADYDATASEAKRCEFLADLHRTLNAPSSKIRNRLLRLTAESPDLLGVIKAEGKE
jgi:type I restriction-modification system DNA methylase subunit